MRNWILIILLFSFSCGTKTNKHDEEGIEEKVPLIDRIALEDLQGAPIMLNNLKGKVVFLNYWATWCKPCVKEMPSISKASKMLKDEPVVFIVASDEDLVKIQKFVSKLSYEFEFAHSLTSVFDLDIKALPTTMIISPEGKIVFNEIGGRDWSTDRNIELIKRFISTPN